MSESPKEIKRLRIYKNHQELGSLMRTERGYALEYQPEWIGKQISYHLKGTVHPLIENGVNLPPYFANLLPEGLRLKAMVKTIKTSEDDLFSLLVASGQDCIGDLTCAAQAKEDADPIKLNQVNFYELFDRSLEQAPHESISGVQEKISASMISFPLRFRQNNKRYLLKLNPPDKKNLVENEFQCMKLARACGLSTANFEKVVDRDGNMGLLVERFDRVWNSEQKDFELIHQEDGCQILNLYPAQKYLVSINELAKAIAALSPSPELEILSLMQWVGYSYLMGNGDLHAKNISLYDPPGRVRQLTPAYDLISTSVYGDQKMALKIDGFDDNLTKKLLIDFCNRFEIPTKAAQQMLAKLVDKFSKNHLNYLGQIPLAEKERARLNRMIQKRVTDLTV